MDSIPSTFSLCDAHAHMGSETELKERLQKKIPSLICASTPEEAARLERLAASPFIIPTYGLHPWQAGTYSVAEMKPYLEKCNVIGELGLDSVWCSVPLSLQENAFREQLAIASDEKKPVILHTKGQERQAALIIKEYANTYLVHWYSSFEHLECYLSLNCYYSIGPDVIWNKAVQKTAELIPLDKLLAETDGMSAVAWAYREKNLSPMPDSVEGALNASLQKISKLRHIPLNQLKNQINYNFQAFLN